MKYCEDKSIHCAVAWYPNIEIEQKLWKRSLRDLAIYVSCPFLIITSKDCPNLLKKDGSMLKTILEKPFGKLV